MRSRILLVAALALLLGMAPAPLPRKDRHREDPTDVTGTWEIVRWESSGRRSPSREESMRVEMTRERFAFVEKEGAHRNEFVMRLEPTLSPPGFAWSRALDQVTLVGSYRLQKDELTLILSMSNRIEDRPTDFAGKPATKLVLRRLSR